MEIGGLSSRFFGMFWRGFKALPDVLEGFGEVSGGLNLPWGFQVNFREVSERFQGITV